jgi:hypothetical protein
MKASAVAHIKRSGFAAIDAVLDEALAHGAHAIPEKKEHATKLDSLVSRPFPAYCFYGTSGSVTPP